MLTFGIFDHVDDNGSPRGEQFEDRIKLVELLEAEGFYGYHLAEHHATPLGTVPCPSVFLAALAQRTRRIRFGPLVYVLPLHHPLRLYEEICMLDHMSGGRLLLGVGRGGDIAIRYRKEWGALGRKGDDLSMIGITRHIVVADTDAVAQRIARAAYPPWREAIGFLWERSKVDFVLAGIYPKTFEELQAIGHGIAGSPAT